MWPKILFLFFSLSLCSSVYAGEKELLVRENRLLESEISLASKPKYYLVFDLKEKKILVKARGFVLREVPIGYSRLWGDPPDLKPLALVKKSTLMKPGRNRIKPGENKDTDTFEIDALELDDMPSAYSLSLEQGVSIFIKSSPQGVFSWFYGSGYSLKRTMSYPLLTVWGSLRSKPFTAIDIVLKREDAQAVYWTFTEGTGTLIRLP